MNPPKILIADNNQDNLQLFKTNLVSQDYELVITDSLQEVLKIVAANSIDLIILDAAVLGENGFEVIKQLKDGKTTRFIPVILVTDIKEAGSRMKGARAGCDDFLTKPIDEVQLTARVASLLKVKAFHDLSCDCEKKLEHEVAIRTHDLNHLLKTLKASSLETIYRLSLAAEYKDENTGSHIQRMSYYAAAIARSLGLDKNIVNAILYAAPMHDIGKIGVPDHILLKPAMLNIDEWKIMKQHTIIGAKILEGSDSEFIKVAEIIALTHHEKYNGRGYPNGLKGEEIPLIGRIAAIADVFDALTTKRPYKEPFSADESFDIIKRGRGIHFDPKVTDAFFAIKDEILSIKNECKECGWNKPFKID